MANILMSGKYTDFKVIGNGKEWNIHRVIVCPKSEYFTRLCDSNFREAVNGELDLSAEDPGYVEKMLIFLYTDDYDINDIYPLTVENFSHPDATISAAQVHIAIYALADKYMIPTLKTCAAEKFVNCLPSSWIDDEWAIVHDIVENTASSDLSLKDPIISQWLKTGHLLIENPQFCEKLAEYPDMEIPFLRKYAKIKSKETEELLGIVPKLQNLLETVKKAEESKKAWNQKLSNLLNRFNQFDNCRHCSVTFQSYFEDSPNSNEPHITMRCKQCRTRHK